MPIFRVVPNGTPRLSNIQVLTDVHGHEAGRILHSGACPLRGHVQRGGTRGPSCTLQCAGPTPPVLVERVFPGLVIAVDDDKRTALLWSPPDKRAVELVLNDGPVLPDRAVADAGRGVRKLYESWQTWRDIEEMIRKERVAAREAARLAEERRQKAELDRILQEVREEEAQREALRERRLLSILRNGKRIRVVADPPGFAAKMRTLKPRNRTPSSIGLEGICTAADYGPYVYMRFADNSMRRFLRSQVRVVFPDGSLGEEDSPPR